MVMKKYEMSNNYTAQQKSNSFSKGLVSYEFLKKMIFYKYHFLGENDAHEDAEEVKWSRYR